MRPRLPKRPSVVMSRRLIGHQSGASWRQDAGINHLARAAPSALAAAPAAAGYSQGSHWVSGAQTLSWGL